VSGRLDEALAALAAAREQRATPPNLFGPPAELAPVTRAIESPYRHAPNEWQRLARDAVKTAASRHDLLTVDEVTWPDVELYEARARGGVMRRAARAGWIESTQTYRLSERPETHRRPLLIWRSLIHPDGGAR
jgi:hypothetical protein